MENGTTILFGLPGVAVERVGRVAGQHGEPVRLVRVVTTASSATGCPACGVVSTSVKQYRTTRPRDVPYGEERLEVRWRKRQYRCREAACPRQAFTESVPEIPPRARLTGRLCRKAAAQVASGRSVSSVAAEYQVSWLVAHRHYAALADGLLTEPDPPAVLGIDETRRGRPKWIQDAGTGRWVRSGRFETSFTDASGTGRLLGRSPGGPARPSPAGWMTGVADRSGHQDTALLLLDLVPPMDRAWTGAFVLWSATAPQYAQAATFTRTFTAFAYIARACEPARYIGNGWRTSRTKILDNAVIGYCKINGISPARA